MEEPAHAIGGREGDIRSLYYWSRAAFVILVVAGAVWVLLAAYRIYLGLTWYGRDWLEGSTKAVTDFLVGAVFMAAGIVCFLLARWLRNDVVVVFSARRFQVPREKLLVYSILAFPLGFIVPGVLLSLVNVKLSYPEFLPTHAEAYPDAMPGYVMVPRAALTQEVPLHVPDEDLLPVGAPRELAPLGFESLPVTEEEAMPAPEFFGEAPPVPAHAPVGAPAPGVPGPTPPGPVPMVALVEEIEEEIPEVMAEMVPPTAPVPAIEEGIEVGAGGIPGPEEVEATGAPPEEGFELLVDTEEGAEEPRTIESAHAELLGRLLRK